MQTNMTTPSSALVSPSAIVPISDRNAWCKALATDRHLTSRARLIGFCMAFSDADQTYEEIGKSTGCSRRAAMRAVATLIARGWIIVISSMGGVANSFAMAMRGEAAS
jgi:hypothetical protein